MPIRKTPPALGEYYHVFNRGVEKRTIFSDKRDYQRFLEIMAYYLDPTPIISFSQRHRIQIQDMESHQKKIRPEDYLIEVISFCLMPNHFHLLVRVNADYGLQKWIRLVSSSYAHSYNIRWGRVGPLFQGPYKLVHTVSNNQLVHLSRYIHLNPVVAKLENSSNSWLWSSMRNYMGQEMIAWLGSSVILNQFQTLQNYQSFVDDYADYALTLSSIKQLLVDIED